MQNLKTVDFDVAFTLTRPAPADYEDKDGNTQTAAANEPRFNYSNGVARGLLLDASLSETAAIDDVPAFNVSAGHWIIDAEFYNSEPLKGMGLNEVFVGSGKMVVSYSGGTAKVWAGGQAIHTVASYTPVEPTHICEGGMATIGGLTYKPSAISDADAAALATGEFSAVPYDPLTLFSEGQQGAWYDPSDLTTLYQDAAGTTPVTADGDPVGLMLDKSQGMAWGPELLQNTGFDEGLAGWDYTDAATEYVELVDGKAKLVTNSYAVAQVTQALPAGDLAGKLVEISADVSDFTGGTRARIYVSGSPYFLSTSSVRATDGKLTLLIAVPQGTTTIQMSFRNVGSGTAVESSLLVDNTSARVLPGNPASQSVAASRRLYKTNGSESWLLDDLVEDGINAQLPDLGTNATLAYADGSGVTILTGQTISGSTPLPAVAETYGVIYLDRPLTADETESVTTYLNRLRGA